MTGDPLIYLVDDDPAVLRGLSRLLRSWRYRSRTFERAQDFLDHYEQDSERPDCLVLDVHMPGLSGIALQARLNESGRAIPVVFLTGHLDPGNHARAIAAGAIDFLEKPIGEKELLHAVGRAVRQGRSDVG